MKRAILIFLIIMNLLPDIWHGEYRNPFSLVTWTIGTPTDTDGNGMDFTCNEPNNYIAYEKGTEPGTTIFTVFIYNPCTLWGDDIIARHDFY